LRIFAVCAVAVDGLSQSTRMPVVWCENLSKTHNGVRKVLDGASLTLHSGDRVAVVGHNGCGKSTLLKILSGMETLDDGTVQLRKGLRIAHVEQEPLVDEEDADSLVRTVLLSGDAPGVTAAREYDAASLAYELAPSDAAAALRFERAAEKMDVDDGWSVEAALAVAAEKLNIGHLEKRTVRGLSGGERKRVSLARALLEKGDVIILDEPTNHLDLWAVRWLEEYLCSDTLASTCVVFVSHDRQFTENVAKGVVEIDQGFIYEHRREQLSEADASAIEDRGESAEQSLVAAYMNGKAKRLADKASASQSQRVKLRTEMAWLQRGAKARQTKSTERITRVETLIEDVKAGKAAGRGSLALGDEKDSKASTTKSGEKRKRTILTIDGLCATAPDGRLIFEDFSREFGHTDRLAVVGANGAGKSTLVRAIVAAAAAEKRLVGASVEETEELLVMHARLMAEQGDSAMRLAPSMRVGYYSQNPPQTLESSPLDAALNVLSRRDESTYSETDRFAGAVELLKRYQFEDSAAWHAPISNLSGGERRRLQLMAVLEAKPNLLILDEPSNDLDLGALQALERFLVESHDGALLLVSHDRALIDATCDELLVLPGDGFVSTFAGSMTQYLELIDSNEAAAKSADKANAKADKADAKAAKGGAKGGKKGKVSDADRKKRNNAPKQIEKLSAQIESDEAKIAAFELDFEAAASDATKAQAIFVQREALQKSIDAKYAEWNELEEMIDN